MASIKVKLRKSNVEEKEGVIIIQIIYNRRVKCLTTRFRLFSHEWDKKKDKIILKAASKEREIYLRNIMDGLDKELERLRKCKEILDKRSVCTIEEWVERYTDRSLNGYLFPFMDRMIDRIRAENRNRTAAIYSVAMKSLQSFRQGADILIESIDSGLVRRYENYLKLKHISMNTISCYMRVLRAVYNRAAEEGLTSQRLPFKNVYTGVARTAKRAVNETLIVRLKGLDLSKNLELSLARDLFMFSFYTRGMSFVDMANLRRYQVRNGYLTYTRSKTRQNLRIRIEPCMEEIFERYRGRTLDNFLLPVYHPGQCDAASALRTYNKRLERISARLGLEKPLTSYVARHSWATIALRKGIPVRVISEGMGHESEHTTRIYLAAIEQSAIDQANARVIAL
ncbi:MAG: site-specific integrase [Tannerellaceae bacterium]|jgi:site-specific recombinase XerD|nr:site-specific integrase [Tannerellaceae bacterium]